MLDINCVDYSPKHFGLVAANNKHPHIFDITNPDTDDVIVLKTNHSRVSTCLAFNTGDVLAVGLERIKNHHGVHVYDNPTMSRNYRSYLNNDHINSLKFIPREPFNLLAGTSTGLKEIDLRMPSSGLGAAKGSSSSKSSAIYSIPTSYTNYLDVGPFSDFFFSSVSNDKNGKIAIWDRRYLVKNGISSAGTAGGDISDDNQSATSSVGKLANPVIELSNIFNDEPYIKKNVVPCYRFSPWNYNEVTTLLHPTKANSLLKRWSFGYEVLQPHDSYANVNSDNEFHNIDSLFVSKAKDITDVGRMLSFDYCKSSNDNYYGSMVVLKLSGKVAKFPIVDGDSAIKFNNFNSVVVGLGNRLFLEEATRPSAETTRPVGLGLLLLEENSHGGNKELISPSKKANITKKSDLSKLDGVGKVTAKGNESILDSEKRSSYDEDLDVVDEEEEDDDEEANDDDDQGTDDDKTEDGLPNLAALIMKPAYEVLLNDIATVMYKRALNNYNLTDLYQNSELFSQFNKKYIMDDSYLNSNYEQLRICWKWLYYSNQNCLKYLTVQNGLNISFEGIYNIWDGISEVLKNEKRRVNVATFFRESKTKKPEKAFLATLDKILSLVHKPGQAYVSTINTKTAKPTQRKYCLFSCGWFITNKEFDAKIQKLIKLKYYEKAAGLCVFQNDVLRAIEILSSVPDEPRDSVQEGYNSFSDLRIIAAAMMGFYNRNMEKVTIDDNESSVYNYYDNSSAVVAGEPLWKEQCRRLARTLPSPYLRAIFAYLTDRNWQDVLEEQSLALKEKLLIALKFLPDDKLTEYLRNVTKDAIKAGNPEGIMLTGLTKKGLSLLQSYNDRYADIQTVALISAFAVPRFFDDFRADSWIGSYCDLLNSWKLFKIRAKFDIARRKLSKNYLYVNKVGGASGGVAGNNNIGSINVSEPRSANSADPSLPNSMQDFFFDDNSSTKSSIIGNSAAANSTSSLFSDSTNNNGNGNVNGNGNLPLDNTLTNNNLSNLNTPFFLPKKQRQLYLKCIQCDRDISHLLHNRKPHGADGDGDDTNTKGKKNIRGGQFSNRNKAQSAAAATAAQKAANAAAAEANASGNGNAAGATAGGVIAGQNNKDKSTVTCVCGASLPKCSICLYSLGAPIQYSSSTYTDAKGILKNEEFFRDWGSFCLNCNHGMHAKHADDWFSNHSVCPVPDCNCHCIIDNL